MILSSADIVRALGADAIIRQEARLSVVDGRPGLDTDDYVYIYVDKYPTIDEFEATWKIWVQDNSGMGKYVLDAMTSLLPNFDFRGEHYTTTDFASDRTVVKTEAEKQLEQLVVERQEIKNDFSDLQKGLQDRLESVRDGIDGLDGKDGRDGRDGLDGLNGRDGRDLIATDAELFDLKDVESSPIPLKKGQVLTWDGDKWTNLYVRQATTYVGGGGGSGGGGGGGGQINSDTITSDTVPTEREDGKGALRDGDTWWKSDTGQLFVYYVDSDTGQWVEIDTGDGGGGGSFPEAPIDGKQYARQNAGWSVVNVPDQLVLSVNSQTGNVVLDADDISDNDTTNKFVTQAFLDDFDEAIESIENIQFQADAGYADFDFNGANLIILEGGTAITTAGNNERKITFDLDDTAATPGAYGGADTVSTFTVDQQGRLTASANVSIQITQSQVTGLSSALDNKADLDQIPTKTSDLTNDSGFITAGDIPPSGIEEAPQDGKFYVRANGAWVDLVTAIADLTIEGGVITSSAP